MRILFFSPHAYVTVHSLSEAIVAEALKERGHDVTIVSCGGVLSKFCISMSAARLSPQSSTSEKENVCEICRERRDLIIKEFRFSSINIDEYLIKDDEASIQNIISNICQVDFTGLTLMDIPVGRYALYEFLLHNKLNTLSLTNVEWEEYKIYLYNCLRIAYAGNRIFEDVKPDTITTYNSLYSVNHIFCAIAEQRGIPHYTLHGGNHIKYRYSSMTIFRGYLASSLITRTEPWGKLSKMPISANQVQVVAEHVEELLKAKDPFVYSTASKGESSESLRKYFGIGSEKKVLLATMASADERFAGAMIDVMPPLVEPMFPTQIDWINALTEFVRNRNDLFLIIRVNPREFPNKRDGVLSKQAVQLQNLFVNLQSNVSVNWPHDEISIYSLAKITDVGLNATSTTGIELGMLGVPVVLYDADQLFAYPPEINYVASGPDDYFNKIDVALRQGWSFENVRKVYRWLSYNFQYVAIDISDGLRKPEAPSFCDRVYYDLLRRLNKHRLVERQVLIRRLKKRNIPVKNSELLSIAIEQNLESHLELINPDQWVQATLEEETTAIKNQISELFQFIALKDDPSDEFTHRINQVLSVTK